jgi:hypothetical protein
MPRSKRHRKHLANYRFLAGRSVRELLPVVGVGKRANSLWRAALYWSLEGCEELDGLTLKPFP